MSSFVPKLEIQRNIYQRKQNPLGSTTAIGRAIVGSGISSYLFSEQAKKLLLISLGLLVVIGVGIAIYFYIKSYETFKNVHENFENVNDSDRVKGQKNSRLNYIKNIVNSVIVQKFDTYTQSSVKLGNLQLPTTKQGGFLGPYNSGIFDESESVLNSLKMNIRTFFLQINNISTNTLSKDKFPKKLKASLFYTDKSGALNSYNSSDISTLFSYIKEFAFNDNINNKDDPVLILLHFVNLPYSTSQIEEYTEYLGQVSDALTILGNNILSGGYYRSQKEADIFKTDFKNFNQKVIVGTNIDTTIFTKSKLANTSKDLDYNVHFHYYVKGDEKVDSTSKTTDMNKTAFIYNSSTLLKMDNVEKENWKLENKGKFIIIKTPIDKDLLLNEMDKLLNDFGVNIINYNYFDEIDSAKSVRKLYGTMKTKPIFLSID